MECIKGSKLNIKQTFLETLPWMWSENIFKVTMLLFINNKLNINFIYFKTLLKKL